MSSSDISSSSAVAAVPSSSTAATDPASAVSEINQAASKGVSEVQAAASSAVSAVVQAQNSSAAVTKPTITLDSTIIKWGDSNLPETLQIPIAAVDTAKKELKIYPETNGAFDFTAAEIKNASGQSVPCTVGYTTIVPYTNLSDISTLYFTYQGQQIKITVSQ